MKQTQSNIGKMFHYVHQLAANQLVNEPKQWKPEGHWNQNNVLKDTKTPCRAPQSFAGDNYLQVWQYVQAVSHYTYLSK